MTDIVDKFLTEWFWYSVAWSRFGDACRELADLEPEEASPSERQALVDETCRLAVIVSDESDPMIELGQNMIEELGKHDRNDDFLNAVAQIINTVASYRERADSYLKEIANLRVGGQPRTPRRPRVANPFLPIIRSRAESEDERIIIDPGRIEDDESDEEESDVDFFVEEEEDAEEDGNTAEAPAPDQTESDDSEGKGSSNPLADETEMILAGGVPKSEEEESDEEESSDESDGEGSPNPLADETDEIITGIPKSEEDTDLAETEVRMMGRNRRSILDHIRGRKKRNKGKEGSDGDE